MATTLSFTLEDQHRTLRRHSYSAPPSLAVSSVHDCIERVHELTGRVSRLTERSHLLRSKVRDSSLLVVPGQIQRSQSVGNFNFPDPSSLAFVKLLIDEILIMSMSETQPPKAKKMPQCHQCHAPLSDEVHVGIPSGVGRCTLDHWDECEGGIPGGTGKNGKLWAGCPDVETDTSSDSDEEIQIHTIVEGGEIKEVKGTLPGSMSEAASLFKNKAKSDLSPLSLLRQTQDLDESDSSEDEELLKQREEVMKLQREFEAQAIAGKVAAKAARSAERRQRRDQELVELARQRQAFTEIQASLLASTRASSSVGRAPTSTETVKKDLKEKFAEHEAKKPRKAA